MTTWAIIMNLHKSCGDTDRPFFEAVVQGQLLKALHFLEQMDQPTALIARNLEDIIVIVCGSQPLDEVKRWMGVRSAFGLDQNIYRDCVDEAIQNAHMDTAKYMYDMGMYHNCISDNAQLSIIYAALHTKNLDVVELLSTMLGGGWEEEIVKNLTETGLFPINDELFSFVNKKLTPEQIVMAEARFQQSKIYVFGTDNYQVEYGEAFWEGMMAYQQRERLGMEVEHIQSMAAVAPKSKM